MSAALRATALRLLADADAAGIGATLHLGSEATGHKPSILVYGHYADPAPLFRRLVGATWRAQEQGSHDGRGVWHAKPVVFLDGTIDGVAIEWNGSPESAERIKASLAEDVTAPPMTIAPAPSEVAHV